MRKVLCVLLLSGLTATLNAVTEGIPNPGKYAQPFGGVPYAPVQPTLIVLEDGQYVWHMAIYDTSHVYQGEYTLPWGTVGDTFPPPKDWDGDGYDDPYVYRPSNATFYILLSHCWWNCMVTYTVP